ncbi:MAG: DUF1343 domain-containing protein [Oligoflexales bacterium]|nr:DUF1343 domain-containing protein [Oligoflexales bacterium]
MDAKTLVGLEVLRRNPKLSDKWGRCGYLCNQASVCADWTHGIPIIENALGDRFVSLFGPQHGFLGTVQDNMIETEHATHVPSGRPIYSLYSETREPTEEMVEGLDTIIVDLQITGCRIYTFKSTIAGCLRAAKKHHKRVVVLDRPNPVGGRYIEGRCVEPELYSFVGQFTMPMRHGLSAGEAAQFFNSSIGAELEVVALEGWDAKADWRSTGRPWVLTSPNLPSIDPVYVYPGMVIFEGTNISEGRGTGLPFQFIGAPFCQDTSKLIERIKDYCGGEPQGVHLREAVFEPTSGKWMGQECRGVQLHITEPAKIASYQLALSLLKSFWDLSDGRFEFSQQPYEYEFDTLPIKIILGGAESVKHLENYSKSDPYWLWGVEEYLKQVAPMLKYDRKQEILV